VTKIRVGQGFMKKSLAEALGACHVGDELILDEGVYDCGQIAIRGITVTGSGDPSRTVLRGTIESAGVNRVGNVTLAAPPYKNAVYIDTPGAGVELLNCRVIGEPSGKYPAVYCAVGHVALTGAVVSGEGQAPAVAVENGGQLQALGTDLTVVTVNAAKAFLKDCRAKFIAGDGRGVIETSGEMTFLSDEQQRAFFLTGESTCRVERMTLATGPGEVLCDDGFLEIGQVRVNGGGTLQVLTKGNGMVRTASPVVEVTDLDRPVEPEPAPGPKEVVWRRSDNRNFTGAVLPGLCAGDTVVLEPGDYFLDDLDGRVLPLDVSLVGRGKPEDTVVHGTLSVVAGRSAALANLTVVPASGYNGINVPAGTTMTTTDVIVDTPRDSDIPTLFVAGMLRMTGCRVPASPSEQRGETVVSGNGAVEADNCFLGWLSAEGNSAVVLRSGGAMALFALGSAKVQGTGRLTMMPNDCAMRTVTVAGTATVDLAAVTTDADYSELKAADGGTIRITEYSCPDDGAVLAFTGDGGTAEVSGRAVTVTDEETYLAGRTSLPGAVGTGPADDGQDPEEEPSARVDGDGGPAFDSARSSGATDPADPADPVATLMAMTGLASAKTHVQDIIREARARKRRQEQGLKVQQSTLHSMFLGNPGTGKTTVARLLGKALYNVGAVEKDIFVEVGRSDLVGMGLGQSAIKTKKVLEQACGGVLFIDEAYTLYQDNNNEFGQEAVDTLLDYMEKHRADIMVIFAGYTDRMQDFLGMNPGLVSRVPNRVDFEDYSVDEIAEIGYRDLRDRDYIVDEDLYRRAIGRKYATSADESNARWARNFNDSLVKVANRRIDRIDDPGVAELMTILDEDVHTLTGGDAAQQDAAVAEILAELDGMLGLAPVKEWVRQLVNRVTFDREQSRLGGTTSRPNYHMVFTGNPGTGKTTVARIIGRLFHELGILDNPTVKEVDRSDLVGSWIGHTEKQTTRVLDEAMGGVLFVDEAYQLYKPESPNDFGGDAIEALMTRLENDRGKFVAIFAGYTDEMEEFLGANPGLRSRVPEGIEFPDYTPEEVGEMVALRLGDRWQYSRQLVVDEAARRYAALPAVEQSNGRWARTFAERVESAQKDYVVTNKVTGPDMTRIPDALIVTLPD
jgi:SpoVK/Ycf46/Vps4 family AAA+-type ATPase